MARDGSGNQTGWATSGRKSQDIHVALRHFRGAITAIDLFCDLSQRSDGSLSPAFLPTSPGAHRHDKSMSDILVTGYAYLPDGGSTRVRVQIGDRDVGLAVHPPRTAILEQDHYRMGNVESMSRIEMSMRHAYGGRTFSPSATTGQGRIYPRNPSGRGFVLGPDLPTEVDLPCFEIEDTPLDLRRLVVEDFEAWPSCPLPIALSGIPPESFLRSARMGRPETLPANLELEEQRRGFLPAWDKLSPGWPPPSPFPSQAQEAWPQLIFADLKPGTEVVVTGMHRSGEPQRFVVPTPPELLLEVEGRRTTLASRLTTMRIDSDAERAHFTFHGSTSEVPRSFSFEKHDDFAIYASRAEGQRVAISVPRGDEPADGFSAGEQRPTLLLSEMPESPAQRMMRSLEQAAAAAPKIERSEPNPSEPTPAAVEVEDVATSRMRLDDIFEPETQVEHRERDTIPE